VKNLLLSLLLVLAGAASLSAATKKIILIAGPLDDHPPGTHEYENNVLVLKHCLENTSHLTNLTVESHFGGWPKDPATLDSADTIVLTSGGSDRNETDHPLYVGDRFKQLETQMNRGCGLVMFHWSVFHPQRHHEKITEWLGGYFDYETGTGGPTQKWFSQIQHATWPVAATTDHPVARGIKQFTLSEEFYFNIRFRENDPRVTPILWKESADRKENIIAWAVQRQEGGRGFGFTGGHFYTNWWVPEFRKVLLNGILWTAKLEVPNDGVNSSLENYAPPTSAKVKAPASSPTESPKPARKAKPSTPAKDSGAVGKEEAWRDTRWNQTDIGSFLGCIPQIPTVAKGLSVRVGANNEGGMCYNLATLDFIAAWDGGFLKFDSARFGLIMNPSRDGELRILPQTIGWHDDSIAYRGLHANGNRVVLSYSVGQTDVLESPWLESSHVLNVFARTFHIGPADKEKILRLAQSKQAHPTIETVGGVEIVRCTEKADVIGVAVHGGNAKFRVGNDNAVELVLPPSATPRSCKVLMWAGAPATYERFVAHAQQSPAVENLVELAKPGPKRWGEPVPTKGQIAAPSSEPYVVDTITVPYNNPFKALMFLSGIGFFSNGDAAVCTIHGDVWLVRGIDEKLENISWTRFATGLFQPLGLKVIDDKIYVLGRDQITLLHDRDGNEEADFYENFCNKIQTSRGGHDYVTSLETDAAGNFYYVCPAGVHRVSKDGKQHETLAAGFRNPNGMGVGPNGVITVAPQEGEWTPSSSICEIVPGGFYGYGGPQITSQRPLGYDAPLCWIPRMIDNSSGSQVWVTSKQWGLLEGQMLNLSFGRCSMMLVLREVVDGQAQGGVVPLKPRFLSGAMRGAFRPQDGQLYVVGSHGWSTSASRDGCFQRVRYTGKRAYLPVGLNVAENGIRLTFSEPLERETAEDTGSYGVEQWNYRYAKEYGSKEYSVASPSEEGHDELEIQSAKLSPDRRSVFLSIAGLQPVMQMQIQYNVNAADGKAIRGDIYNTINRLGKAE
jgi:type 1 glutamine amidotransferase